MKTLKKLKLKEFQKMNESEMKSIIGGYGDSYSTNSRCTTEAQKACENKSVGDTCSYTYDSVFNEGLCCQNAFHPCKYCMKGVRAPHY